MPTFDLHRRPARRHPLACLLEFGQRDQDGQRGRPGGLAGGIAAVLLIGAVAGLYPATRAARLAPTDALRTV